MKKQSKIKGQSKIKRQSKIKGRVRLEITHPDGTKEDTGWINNLVVSAGLAQLALLAGDATATPFTYLAVGTSSTSPSAGQTALVDEITDSGLARAAATVSRTNTSVANDTLRLVYTWTASGTKTVEEIGAFNASSSGTMLGRALTGSWSLVNGSLFAATYDFAFA